MSDQLYEEWRAACDKVVELTVQNANMQENLTDLEEQVAELREIVDLAVGLSHGTDWNNGTHATKYRWKLEQAITAMQKGEA